MQSLKRILVTWAFPLAGLLALVWFLFRVLPKPSRATYPCQRAAFPLASSFILWLFGSATSGAVLRKAKGKHARKYYIVLALICLLVAVGASWLVVSRSGRGPKFVPAEPQPVNEPIGVAKGIFPGRVVWVHDANATDWKGPDNGHPWEDTSTDQAVVDAMCSLAVRNLTGADTDVAAWDKLFRHLNKTRGKGDVGYTSGEKIAIKTNFVGFLFYEGRVSEDDYNLVKYQNYMNTSPRLIIALLRQLVNIVGVDQADISIGDTVTYMANEYYNIFAEEFPKVRYLDHGGKSGRTKARQSSVPLYWSCHPEGTLQDYVPVSYAEAEYLINCANLKSHTGAGVTLCGKNHFGSLVRWPGQEDYYDLHSSVYSVGMRKYRPQVDLMGHSHIGGKTVLYLIDGLYSGQHGMDWEPRKWKMAPFNNDWTSSVFVSQDPVAIDSVGLDFLQAEWHHYPHWSGADDYLHEAALADKPPSWTFYDPDHAGDVNRLPSLGVHEHWNNPKDKQYSRNLRTGEGIELVAVTPNSNLNSAGSIASAAEPNELAEGPVVAAERIKR